MTQYVYFFGGGKADGHRDMKDLLGGKGSGLAEMTNAGLPVPPGFTISTEACNIYYERGGVLPGEVGEQSDQALARLEGLMGKKLGDAADPLLVSVRSGSKFSMPGMMDTILNLGLNDRSVEGLKAKTGNGRFAKDSYRRFLQMYGNVVLGIEKDKFEHELTAVKKKVKAKADLDLDEKAFDEVIVRFKAVVQKETHKPFPQDPKEQLTGARDAVFKSWMNPRAMTYRKLNDIAHNLGTAVNVQSMVFGNMGDTSATGVGFTRNPSNGKKEFYGEFLQNAQGEDVVAGIRTPHPITDLEKVMPAAYRQLREITTRLEKHYKDIQDFEFTIQDNTLYMLQTRNGKRTGVAAVHIAVDLEEEGILTKQEAVMKVEPQALDQLLHPIFDPKERAKAETAATGLPASPGAATGAVVFTADEAVAWAHKGKRVLLVRNETAPDDIHGMSVAQGILTATGGMTSHAAVVGRQMGKPSVVGCGALHIDAKTRTLKVAGRTLSEGDMISIDGATGDVILKELPTSPSEVLQVVSGKLKPEKSALYQKFEKLLSWADEIRRLGIRANADIPRDAKVAFAFGARGIGLCRTEHMFFAEDRLPYVVKMILSAARGQRGLDLRTRLKARLKEARGSQAAEVKKELAKVQKEYGKFIKDYEDALKKLLPMQRADFAGLFKEMHGTPVTIRTLDPPLHEFLPKREELMVKVATLERQGRSQEQDGHRRRREAPAGGGRAPRVQPHARPPGLSAGDHLSRDHPHAGPCDLRGRPSGVEEGHAGEARGHDSPRGPRRGAPPPEADRDRGSRAHPGQERLRGGLPRGHHDRGAAGGADGRRDREGGAVLLLRHQRPHPDGLRPLPGRRGQVPALLPGARPSRQGPVRVPRHRGGGPARGDRGEEGSSRPAGPQDRHLRRARWRSGLDPLLPQGGPRLRVVLALPGAHRAPGRGPGQARAVRIRLAERRHRGTGDRRGT